MSSGIVLSAGVRQNLLSLQNTAALAATTENRLATGKKVNSALDNPTNFFTASSLTNRSSDLSALLDNIGNAQQTLQAANQGLTSLTALVQSAKSLATQAQQATSGTVNYNLAIGGTQAIGADTAATETGSSTIPADTAATLTGTGAALGPDVAATVSGNTSIATNSALTTLGATVGDVLTLGDGTTTKTYTVSAASTVANLTAALTTSAPNGATVSVNGSGFLTVTENNNTKTATLTDNAGTAGNDVKALGLATGNATSAAPTNAAVAALTGTVTITIGSNATKTLTFGGTTKSLADINSQLASIAGGTASVDANGNLTVTATTADQNIVIGGTAASETALGVTANSTTKSTNSAISALAGKTLVVQVGSATAHTLTFGTGAGQVQNRADLVSQLNALADVSGTLSGSNLVIADKTDTTNSVSLTGSAQGVLSAIGFGGVLDTTHTIDPVNAAVAALAGGTLTIQVGNGATNTITFGAGAGQVHNRTELSAALATAVQGSTGVTASVDATSHKVSIVSTASDSITVGGDNATLTGLGITAGTSSPTATVVSASATRTDLQNQYNDILTQIDSLAQDASFNGVNLLNGDNLKVTFNETGTSSLTIKGVTLGSAGLGLTQQTGNAFQDNNQINTTIDSLTGALTTLRNQATKFGSNVTVVQTRQDFTKDLINVLQTGADNLTLADTNQEGANLLALQTRQQLSTTALSLANQANQAVLRLFG